MRDVELIKESIAAVPADAIHVQKGIKRTLLQKAVLCFFVNDKTKPLATVEGPAP